MDTVFLSLSILTVVVMWVTFDAWRTGSEMRDIKLMGVVSAILGVGTAVSALV